MSTKVNHHISPALNPDNVLLTIEGADDPNIAAMLAPTVTAFSEAYERLGKVRETRETVKRNPAMTEAAQVLATDEFATKHLGFITKNFDNVRANLVKTIDSLEQQLSQPLESKAAASIAAEIRAHCKSLPNEQRHGFIQKALDSGDATTASAILGTVPYLSGLDANFQQVYTRRWNELHAPELSRRLKAMVAAREMIERNAPLVFREMEKAVGMAPAKVKQLREAKTASDQALLLKDA